MKWSDRVAEEAQTNRLADLIARLVKEGKAHVVWSPERGWHDAKGDDK